MSGVLPLITTAMPVNKMQIKFYWYRDVTNISDVPIKNGQMQILFYAAENQYLKLAFLKEGVYYKLALDSVNGTWIKF